MGTPPPKGGPPCISLHPAAAFESDPGRRDEAGSDSDSTDSANEEDELVSSIQRLSVSETELRLDRRPFHWRVWWRGEVLFLTAECLFLFACRAR